MSLRLIAKDALKGVRSIFFANEHAPSNSTDFALGPESPIDLANASGDGWQIIAPYGEFAHPNGLQSFQKIDAENVVKDFKSFANPLVKAFGVPFYIGHPDHEAFAGKSGHQDSRAYGRIKSLEARDTGLFGNVKWSRAGREMIEDGAFHGISPNWRVQRVGSAYHPFSLKSVGFTNSPNMPIPAPTVANSKPIETMNKELLKLLGLAENATEADVQTKVTELANSLTAAQATIVALKKTEEEYAGKKTEFANAQTKLGEATGKITALEGQVTTLTSERDSARTNFANERKERAKLLLDTAEKAGRITAADRKTYETEFANEATFDATVTKLANAKGNSTLPIRGTQVDRTRNTVSPEKSRMAQVHEFVNEKIRTKGVDYNTAFAQVQREHKELFDSMTVPGQEQ